MLSPSLARIASDTFLLAWNVSSAVTFVVPLFAFSVARLTSDQEYDENQNNNNNYNNNYNNGDDKYQNPDNYDQYGNYVGPTYWWQFWKSNSNYEQEEGSNDEYGAPWWYIWGEREGGEPDEEGSGAVLFVYLYTLLFFAGLIYVGNTTRMSISKLQALRLALFGFANYCFVIMVLLIGMEDVIQTEGREIEETGFYGQRAVLLLITCLFALVQSIVFLSWTTKRLKHLNAAAEKPDEYVNVEFDKTDALAGTPDYQVTI